MPHDSRWAESYQAESKAIRAALGDYVLGIEHFGSTDPPRRVWRVLPLGRMGTWDRSHRGGIQTS
ncbi:GrpB family protein [Mycolicibacterium smegmatis]|nr:GrpB family protein [Mycolicibacterium smegmatis]UGU34507.1 GrpB family protein [Mycolicibacterium smegmatis]